MNAYKSPKSRDCEFRLIYNHLPATGVRGLGFRFPPAPPAEAPCPAIFRHPAAYSAPDSIPMITIKTLHTEGHMQPFFSSPVQ